MERAERAGLHRLIRGRDMDIVEVAHRDGSAWRQFAFGERDAEGALILAIEAKEARLAGFDLASGGVAFDLLLEAARRTGPVPAVMGCWYGSSENLAAFWARKDEDGVSDEQAASSTWTGDAARKRGYRTAEIVSVARTGVMVRFNP